MFYTIILLMVLWHLTEAALKAILSFGLDSASGDLVSDVDSFSQPAIAVAVLKHETALLSLAYGESQYSAKKSRTGPVEPYALNTNELRHEPNQGSLRASQRIALATSPGSQIERLHAAIQELNVDLDWQLMAMHFADQSWNEFLDCYLRLLTEAPGKANVLWARSALECSQRCGRTREVVDSLEHLVRFHSEIKAANACEATLEEWKENHPVSLGGVTQ
jgi:hypothetical protein